MPQPKAYLQGHLHSVSPFGGIHSHALESHPRKWFHSAHPHLLNALTNSCVLRKHCWTVLQDVVIYPRETPPSCEAQSPLRGRMGRAGQPGKARNCTGLQGTEEETTERGPTREAEGRETQERLRGSEKRGGKDEEGRRVSTGVTASASFLVFSIGGHHVTLRGKKKRFQNMFRRLPFIHKLQQVLRLPILIPALRSAHTQTSSLPVVKGSPENGIWGNWQIPTCSPDYSSYVLGSCLFPEDQKHSLKSPLGNEWPALQSTFTMFVEQLLSMFPVLSAGKVVYHETPRTIKYFLHLSGFYLFSLAKVRIPFLSFPSLGLGLTYIYHVAPLSE